MRIKSMKNILKPYLIASVSAAAVLFSGCADAQSSDQAPSLSQTEAQAAAQVATQKSVATPMMQPNWDILAEGSHIRFTAQQEGADFTGSFAEFTGEIAFDPDAPETGSVSISIPLSGVDAGSKDRNSTLPAKVWFSTKAFPSAVFTSDQISRDGEGYLAKGSLTQKGKSAPVELPFTLEIDGDRAVMNGTVTIDRTIWDVGSSPWDTDEWVSRSVTLDIKVTAKRR